MTRLPQLLLALILAVPATADEERLWDQDKAIKRVEEVLAIEAKGQPWDKIPWLTDPDLAAKKAEAENKPVFVYLYLEKKVGPAAAPG